MREKKTVGLKLYGFKEDIRTLVIFVFGMVFQMDIHFFVESNAVFSIFES